MINRHKIVHITTTHDSRDNRIFRKECSGLAEAGYDVTLLAPGDVEYFENGVRVIPIGLFGSRVERMVVGPVRVVVRLWKLKPAVVHVHDPELVPVMLLLKFLARRVRLIYDAHEDLPGQVMSKQYLPLVARPLVRTFSVALCRIAGAVSDAVVCATPAIQSTYPSDKTILVQNFPWLLDFAELSPSVPKYSASYVGGLNEIRGGLELAAAFDVAGGTRITCIAAGSVSERVAHALSKVESVRHLGRVAAEEVPEVIVNGLVGIVCFLPAPNHVESQPTKMFEYMAAGRAIICSDFPLWRDIIEEHKCGFLVDPSDPGAIRNAVVRAVEDRNGTLSMGVRARAAFESHYTFDIELPRLLDLYSAIVYRADRLPA